MTELTEREKKVKAALYHFLSMVNSQPVERREVAGTIEGIITLLLPPPVSVPVIPAWEELTNEQRKSLMVADAYSTEFGKQIYGHVRAITAKPAGD
jgi:hypothetical protein